MPVAATLAFSHLGDTPHQRIVQPRTRPVMRILATPNRLAALANPSTEALCLLMAEDIPSDPVLS